jgi:rhamnose utilization protein RhaD (predicted bifunctional aldolase and dehydrogenase)
MSQEHWLVHRRASDEIMAFVDSAEALDWSQRGPLTPDHVIRTKGVSHTLIQQG